MLGIKLFPKGGEFFELFERSAARVHECAEAFRDLVENYTDVERKVAHIKDLEHACDKITHETMERLNKTFITPLDREDIHALITSLDDICDMIDATAIRVKIYKVDRMTEPLKDQARLLVLATREVHGAVSRLREFRAPEQFLASCIEINRLENESDQVLRRALGDLFETEKDAIRLIKWKEIYENIEAAVDCCEDMANAIESVVLKNA
jgi:hypothetical protein